MKARQSQMPLHPVVYYIQTLLNKIRQNHEVYPIKYYKKSNKYRRDWKSLLLR